LEKLWVQRYDTFKECRLKEIDLPHIGAYSLKKMSMDDINDSKTIKLDYNYLSDNLKHEDSKESCEAKLLEELKDINAELERMAPNRKAIEKYY
jgi:hypothetical protein